MPFGRVKRNQPDFSTFHLQQLFADWYRIDPIALFLGFSKRWVALCEQSIQGVAWALERLDNQSAVIDGNRDRLTCL